MIFELEKPKPRNGRFCPALLNVWVYNSEFAKVIDTELISKQCYREYAQMKATKLKVVNAIDKLNYNRRQSANPPQTINVARSCFTSKKRKYVFNIYYSHLFT